MIVELYGLPASGKSHTGKLLKDNGCTLVDTSRRAQMMWWAMRFFMKHPIYTVRQIGRVLVSSDSVRDGLKKLVNIVAYRGAKFECAASMPYEKIVVVVEGTVQNILSLSSVVLEPSEMLQKLTSLPRPDHLILLDVSEEQWETNIKRRGYFGREERGGAYTEAWKELLKANHLILMKVVGESGIPFTIVHSPEECLKVCQKLQSIAKKA